jgi:transglutaminase-like putative cysteine protease
VSAQSVLRTAAPQPISGALATQSWEAVRDGLKYAKGRAYQAETEFLHSSSMVQSHEEFFAFAQSAFAPGRSLVQAARALSTQIHREFRYDSASTDVNTPPLQALRERHGVCQDFAHILIACLRSLGLAARYVSGYLLTEPPPGQPRLIGADASHAWASLYVGGGQWLDLDPTNDRSGLGTPGEDYVTLAIGRDYQDVAPLRGIIHGAQRQSQSVAVTVMPI